MDNVSKDRHTGRFQIVGSVAVLIDSAFSAFFSQERGRGSFLPLYLVSLGLLPVLSLPLFSLLAARSADVDYLLTFYEFYTPSRNQFFISPL